MIIGSQSIQHAIASEVALELARRAVMAPQPIDRIFWQRSDIYVATRRLPARGAEVVFKLSAIVANASGSYTAWLRRLPR